MLLKCLCATSDTLLNGMCDLDFWYEEFLSSARSSVKIRDHNFDHEEVVFMTVTSAIADRSEGLPFFFICPFFIF